MSTLTKFFLSLLTLLVLAGCDGDGALFVANPEGQIVVEPNIALAAAGTTQQYTATLVTLLAGEPNKEDVTASADWVSTNTAVATIDSNGLVTALTAGETDIIATQGFYRGRAKFTVTANNITEITVEPASSSLLIGLEKQYTAIARFADNTTQDITYDATWTSSATAVASINSTGLATAVTVGTTTISASYAGSTGNSDLTVINTLVSDFVVTPFNNELHAGGQKQLQAFLILLDGTSVDVTGVVDWQSSDTAIATVGDISTESRLQQDPKGLVTAVSQGTAVITASAVLPSGPISATANVTVTAPLITALQVVPSVVSVPKGTVGTLRAIAYYTDNSVEDVTRESGWLSDNTAVVFVVTTGNAAGDAIATGVGQTVVTARFDGLTATSSITVVDAVITNILVTPEDLSIPLGSSGHYTATAIYSDLSTADITQLATWVASVPTVIDLVPSGANAGFVDTLSIGNSTVTASYQGVDGSTSIEVTAATLDALQIEPADISVPAGTAGQYTATAYYSDGTSENVTEQATWVSSDQSVFDVVTSGVDGGQYAAYIAGGPVTVTASYKGTTATTSATVTAAVIRSIMVSPVNLSLPVGSAESYRALAIYSDKTVADITSEASWLSSVPTVAQIIATGNNAGSAITLAEGSTVISASLDGVSGATGLTVTPAVITSLQVTPADISVPAGTQGPYTATAFYSDNSSEDVTTVATWVSSNTAVASIVPTGIDGGKATSKIAGSTEISASYSGMTATTPLTVTAAVLISIEVSPVNISVPLGIDVQYTATGIYSDNTNSDLTDEASWQSSDLAVATINAAGFAVTLATGPTTITAKVNTGGASFVTGSTTLTVNAEAVTALVVLPSVVEAHPQQREQFTAIAYYTDDSSRDVTKESVWSSSDDNVVVVVPGGVDAGSAVATGLGMADVIADFETFSGTAAVTIVPAVLQSIQITPIDDDIAKGLTVQYTATGLYSDGSSADITDSANWQSSMPLIATIEQDGLATGVNIGVTSISASLDGVTAATGLTVDAPLLNSIVVTPSQTSLIVQNKESLTATAYYSDGSTRDVTRQSTWISDNPAVAHVGTTVLNAGQVTGVSVAPAVITANYQGQANSANVDVVAATLLEIIVRPFVKMVAAGLDVQYSATGIYNNGSYIDLTNVVTWRSSDTASAVIDLQGLASTIDVGTPTISAQYSSVTGSAILNVTMATITSLQVTPPFLNIPSGTAARLTAIATYTDLSTADVSRSATWTSSDQNIVSVANGSFGGNVVGHQIGNATITAAIDGFTASSFIVVSLPTLDAIQVTPADSSIASGINQQYTATGIYSDSSTADITQLVSWQSSNANAATIDTNGFAVSALGLISSQTTTIMATLGTVSGITELTVTPATITDLVVIPFVAEVHPGQSGQLTAIAYYTDNTTADVTRQANWTSSNLLTVAVVPIGERAGFALAVSANVVPATITARFGGAIGTADILVTPATLTSIQVLPSTSSVPAGNSVQYSAVGTYSDNTSSDITDLVTWTSSDTSVATINLSGLAETIVAGSATITARLDTVSDAAALTVTSAVVTGLQVTPAKASIAAGGNVQLSATAFYSDGTSQDVTRQASWVSDNVIAATVQSNNPNAGLVETHNAGSAIITAQFSGTTVATLALQAIASAEITVTAPIIDSIQVLPIDIDLPNGVEQQYIANAIYTDGSSQDITGVADWFSSDNTVAAVNLTGLVKALQVDPAPVTISASFDSTIGSTTVTVVNEVITQLVITPNAGSVPLGIGGQLIATAYYSDSSARDVTQLATWSSDDAATITVITSGSDAGLAQTLAVGSATVSANYDGQLASNLYTVTPATLVSISVDPANSSVAKGLELQYTATGIYTDGSKQDLTANVDWQSSNPAVATIDSTGLAQSVIEGTAQISASLDGISGKAELVVTAATITSLTIVPPDISLPAGTDVQLQSVAIYSDASTQVVTKQCSWVSAMPTILSVVATGEKAGFSQALIAGGPVTVTATLQDADGTIFTADSKITVSPAVLVEIQVNPPNATVPSGIDVQYVAIGVYTNGDTQNITDSATWSSDDTDLVAIDQTGYATTSESLTGAANISADFDGKTGTTPLNVIAVAPDRLEVSPNYSEIASLTTEQYAATLILNNGNSLDVTSLVTWTSSDELVATISNQSGSNGLTQAHAEGSTEITAQLVYNGTTYSDIADLLVTPAVLDYIVVSSEETTILRGTVTQFYAQAVYVGGATDDITNAATWRTTDPQIAVVSNLTFSKGLAIGTGVGTATISAEFDGQTDSQDLEVITANLVALVIEPLNATIALGGDVQYTATATLDTGDEIDVTTQVIWDSIDEGVAVISAIGNATSVSASSTTISASMDGFNAATNLAVTDSSNIIITISPLNEQMANDTELQFEAQVLIDGVPIEDATQEVDWSTTNCIDENGNLLPDGDCKDIVDLKNDKKNKGLAKAKDIGTVRVVATYTHESTGTPFTASTGLEVLNLDGFPFVLDITPKNASVEKKKHLQYTLTGTWDIGGGDSIVQDLTKDNATSWTTGDKDIATIKNDGGKKGEAKGEDKAPLPATTTIEAQFDGVVAPPTDLTVTP